MDKNCGTSWDLHAYGTRYSHLIVQKTEIEETAELENGRKNDVTDDLCHDNINIEEIYIKSEPVDASVFGNKLKNETVGNIESRACQKTCIISSTEDMSQYNYNTNIIITEEIAIKAECEDDSKYEEREARQDTARTTSCSNPDASVSINKFEKPTTPNKCTCGKTVELASCLFQHKHVSERKPFKCEQCNKAFSRSSGLIKHKRTHSGEKPFKCDQCDKAFSQSANLNIHKRVHSGERQFKCEQCNKAFTRLLHLTTHKQIHSGEKPFKCELCNKLFSRKQYLSNHKLLHSFKTPFKCDQCNKSFNGLTPLAIHKRIHSGEKPI